MRFLFFLIIFTNSFFVYSQLLSPEIEWFGNESFFNDSIIRQHKIAAIHIWDSEKKDGKHFQDEKSFLHYEFNRNGKLTASYKAIVLKDNIDTALFQYYYNQKGQVYKKSEKQGYFQFDFFYFYKNNLLAREVKIDVANQSYDTAFVHYFKHHLTDNLQRLIVQNSIHKPFMHLDFYYNQEGKLIKFKKSYVRNQNYSETSYIYESNKIRETIVTPFGKAENRRTIYSYKSDQLHLIEHYTGDKLIRKFAFIYTKNGLPNSIIERDLKLKKIKIYRLEYSFYTD